MREAASKINDDAAQWVARLDHEGENAALRAEMRAWAEGDERRAGALLRAEAGWMMLNKAAVLGSVSGGADDAADAAAPISANADWTTVGTKRRWQIGGAAMGLAAALALVITPMLSALPVQEIETALGEIRRVPLADGSFAAVNTDSKVDVALKADQRQVILARGEAWFQVAKDAARPFVVEVGDVRVRAVGTAFSVHRQDDQVDVRVTEGVVEMWRVGAEGDVKRVSAGAQAVLTQVADAAAVTASTEPSERTLSWRDGQLIFDGDSVAEAAEQFNRYNHIKIEIANNELGEEKMIGRFRTNEPQAFARAAAAILDAKVDERQNRIIISAH